MKTLNVAFYRFVDLGEASALAALRAELETEAACLGLRGTVLLAPEGINGFLAGEPSGVRQWLEGLRAREAFRGIEAKESFSQAVPFGYLSVRIKREIIPVRDPSVRPLESTGQRLSPQELKQWLDEGRDFILLDTRNDFEVKEGTFRTARSFGLEKFQEFPEALKKAHDELAERPVVMFCTGGIRCEKATALALRQGLDNVFQLEGGILKYFEDCGDAHFDGRCFVFDDRRAVDASLKPFVDSAS